MSKSYIPAQTWVVCTYQLSTSPQKLINTRKASIFYKADRALITAFDRNIDKKFICKKPMNTTMGIGGLLVGVILASNPIGWAVAGVCAVVLIGAATFAVTTHDCSGYLESGKWIGCKDRVKFDGYNAIIETSLLSCSNGGVLQPIINTSVAFNTAKSVAYENMKETAINTTSAIVTGFLIKKSGESIIKNFISIFFSRSKALYTIGGIGATYIMTEIQSNIMRNNEDYEDNYVYQRLNKAEEGSDWEEETETKVKESIESLSPPNIKDLADDAVQLYKTGELIVDDVKLKSEFEKLSKMNKVELRNSPLAKKLLKEIQSQKPEIFDVIKKKQNSKPIRLRPKMRDNAIKNINTKVNQNKWSLHNKNSLLSKGMNIVLFFSPLISGYFSENARRKLAENAIQDITNSISIRTIN